jgi:hypothetical protein
MYEAKAMRMSKAAGAVLLGLLTLAPWAARAEGDAAPKAREAEASASPVEISFTGFARRGDKGAAIFVRMTREVPVAVEQSGRRLVYHLSGAKLGVRNNANPLPTQLFGPPVSNVALVAGSGSVDLVIDLSSDPGEKSPSYRFVSQSGIATLVIELPLAASS